MFKTFSKQLLKDSTYCAKQVGKGHITPNIILHVLALDPLVTSELERNGADTKLLGYYLNPFHVRNGKTKKVVLSPDSKKLFAMLDSKDTALDAFHKMMQVKFVSDIVKKSGYLEKDDGVNLLNKYSKKLNSGKRRIDEEEKFKKIRSLMGKKNVMVMGAIGSGRYAFINDFAKRYEKEFSIYQFDLFKYLKIDPTRLFGIISGVFDDLGDDYLYIPNFMQTLVWIKSLKLDDVFALLEDLSQKGKIITKINTDNFDSKQFHLSKSFNFYSVKLPPITLNNLFDVLNEEATVYEKFYGIDFDRAMLKEIIKESNFTDVSLAQPGRSLKRLMHHAFILYGEDPSIQEKPKGKLNLLDGINISGEINSKVIGQKHAIDEIAYEVGKINFFDGGIVKAFLFHGEIGCGKLKSAVELSKLLFGNDSLRYIDLDTYKDFPYKMRIYDVLDKAISSLYGGVLYLDNIESLNTEEIDVFSYIKMKMREVNDEGVIAPVIVVGSTRTPLVNLKNYRYMIEHFEHVIYFNKLTIRDLEKIAEIQINKVKDILPDKEGINTFSLSAQANSSLNALGVKKLISSMSA